jgi:hypothetical protein
MPEIESSVKIDVMTTARRFPALENKALILDLLEWVERAPRSYNEVMEAWRTSCPRLPVWEEAVDLGLVARTYSVRTGATVHITTDGRALLRSQGRPG